MRIVGDQFDLHPFFNGRKLCVKGEETALMDRRTAQKSVFYLRGHISRRNPTQTLQKANPVRCRTARRLSVIKREVV